MIWIGVHIDGSLDHSIFYWDGNAEDLDFEVVSAPGWYARKDGVSDGPYEEMEDARQALKRWPKQPQTTRTNTSG